MFYEYNIYNFTQKPEFVMIFDNTFDNVNGKSVKETTTRSKGGK